MTRNQSAEKKSYSRHFTYKSTRLQKLSITSFQVLFEKFRLTTKFYTKNCRDSWNEKLHDSENLAHLKFTGIIKTYKKRMRNSVSKTVKIQILRIRFLRLRPKAD